MDAMVAPATVTCSMAPHKTPEPSQHHSHQPQGGHGDWLPLGSPLLHPQAGIGVLLAPAFRVPATSSSAQHLQASSHLSFTLLLRQKPTIKPLAKGQSDNTPWRCSAGKKGLQGPPPFLAEPPSTHHGCMPGWLSITPASPPAPSLVLQGMLKVLWGCWHSTSTSPLPGNRLCCQQPAR